MRTSFTDNISEKLIDTFRPTLSNATEIKIAVAFAKYSGFSLLEKEFMQCLKRHGTIEFLVGLDFRITEPRFLESITQLAAEEPGISLYCYADYRAKDIPVYHPKVYIFKNGGDVTFAVGSSNLTSGGLRDNVEANVIIKSNMTEEAVSDIYELYNRLKCKNRYFAPDAQYIEKYTEIYKIFRKKNAEAFNETRAKKVLGEMKTQQESLPRALVKGNDLYGWHKLVYDRLPDEEFKTSYLYAFESEFKRHYPANTKIQDKTRQILQQLREMNLVVHIERNKWKKTDSNI